MQIHMSFRAPRSAVEVSMHQCSADVCLPSWRVQERSCIITTMAHPL